jgi:hypothetical protein
MDNAQHRLGGNQEPIRDNSAPASLQKKMYKKNKKQKKGENSTPPRTFKRKDLQRRSKRE